MAIKLYVYLQNTICRNIVILRTVNSIKNTFFLDTHNAI